MNQKKKPRRPNAAVIRRVVEHLAELGLEVSGQCIDLENGIVYESNMYYDVDDILRYRMLLDKDAIVDYRSLH